MATKLTTSVVRICRPDGGAVGTGFVVAADGLIATCAHVVEAAGAGPGDVVGVAFHAVQGQVEARVEAQGWRPAGEEDLAFLRLTSALPLGVTPAWLESSEDQIGVPVRAFGYPKLGAMEGLWGEGKLVGPVTEAGRPLLQLKSSEITAGFSGGPVWAAGRVIGMVTQIAAPDRLGKLGEVAFATPSEALIKAWPELEFAPLAQAEDKAALQPASTSLQEQSALLQVLKTTTKLSAKATFYAAALGAIALIPGAQLPPALAAIAGGVGVNALSSILERIARGEDVSEEEKREQIEKAIEESRIADVLAAKDTQIMVARLFRRHDILKFAVQNGEREILERLTEQGQQHEAFAVVLREEISAIHEQIQTLATREQVESLATREQMDQLLSVLLDRLPVVAEAGAISAELRAAPPAGEKAPLFPLYGCEVISNLLTNGSDACFTDKYERLHAAYISPWTIFERVRLDRFSGREWLSAEVDAFLQSEERGYFVLEAEAGLGKTTFLAHLAKQRGYIHHFVELTPGQDGVAVGLRSLAVQLIRAWGLDTYLDGLVLFEGVSWPELLQSLLAEAAQKRNQVQPDEPIVIVVDALDEAGPSMKQNTFELPRILPKGVYFIVSQRPVAVSLQVEVPRHVFRLEAKDEENLADTYAYLQTTVTWPEVANELQNQNYAPSVFVETLQQKCQGVWVYLYYVIREFECGKRSSLDLALLPEGLWQYYAQYWRRWRRLDHGTWYDKFLPLLSTLTAAQEAFSLELLCMLANVEQRPELNALMREEWRPFLTMQESQDGFHYQLQHAGLREFLGGQVDESRLTEAEKSLTAELAKATCQAHLRIAKFYLLEWGGLEANLPKLQAIEYDLSRNYGLRYLPFHLVQGDQIDLLYKLVENSGWSEAKPLITPKAIWYLDDLAFAFQVAIEGNQESIVNAMGYALKQRLVQEQISGPSSEALVVLAELGQFERALELARFRPLRQRVKILERISRVLADKDPGRALVALEELAHAAEDSSNLLNRCVCRCSAAEKMVRLDLSSSKAQSLVDEAQILASSLPRSELSTYQMDWALPAMAVVGRLAEAIRQVNELSTLDRCRVLRRIAKALPSDHSQALASAEYALELSQSLEDRSQSLRQQMLSLAALAEIKTGDKREQMVSRLVELLDEAGDRLPSTSAAVVRRLSKLYPVRIKQFMEQERWAETYDAWDTVVSEMAKVDVDEAQRLLNEKLAHWFAYPYVLVDIIEQLAHKDVDKAEALIKDNEKRLERNLDEAYLALAKGYLAQGNKTQAEQKLNQPAFFVNDEHNIHAQAKMWAAILENAVGLISPDVACDWLGRVPICSYCHRTDERDRARQALIQIAAYHKRHDLLDEYAHRTEDRELAALVMAKNGNIAEAREYMEQHHLKVNAGLGARAHAYIVEAEAKQDPTVLDGLMEHYESEPPHHFCSTMVELPYILDSLTQIDSPSYTAITDFVERIWMSIIHWQCPKESQDKAERLLNVKCSCYSKREQVLGHLVGIMAKINQGRAQEMLDVLPDSPAKALALGWIAQFGQADEAFFADFEAVIQSAFPEPGRRLCYCYELALVLPAEILDNAKELVLRAENQRSESTVGPQPDDGLTVRHSISGSALKTLEAQFAIRFMQPLYTQEQIDGILAIVRDLGEFDDKHKVLLTLFRCAEKWSMEERVNLLKHVLKAEAGDSVVGVQATIASAISTIYAIGGNNLLDKLVQYVDWAYQR